MEPNPESRLIVTIRPPRARRLQASALASVGVTVLVWQMFSSLDQGPMTTVVYAAGAAAVITIWVLGVTARAEITAQGVASRVFVRHFVPSAEVSAVEISPRQIAGSRQISVVIRRTPEPRLLLSQTTCKDTTRNRAVYEQRLPEWRQLLGIYPNGVEDQGPTSVDPDEPSSRR